MSKKGTYVYLWNQLILSPNASLLKKNAAVLTIRPPTMQANQNVGSDIGATAPAIISKAML